MPGKTIVILYILLVSFASCQRERRDQTKEKMKQEAAETRPVGQEILDSLGNYIVSNALDFSSIPEERKKQLNEIAKYITEKTTIAIATSGIKVCDIS